MGHSKGLDATRFITLDGSPLELWHFVGPEVIWTLGEDEIHVLIVKNTETVTVPLPPLPDPSPYGIRYYFVYLINRGVAITFQHQGRNGPEERTLATDQVLQITVHHGSTNVHVDDVSHHWYWANVDSPADIVSGAFSVSCDWFGAESLELWANGSTKLNTWAGMRAGQYVLDVPDSAFNVARGALAEGESKTIAVDLRVGPRILWTGAVRIERPGPSLDVHRFDLVPYLPVHAAGPQEVHEGWLSVTTSWSGTQTLELWRRGGQKLAKWQDLTAGDHVLPWRLQGGLLAELRAGGSESHQAVVELRLADNDPPNLSLIHI